MYYLEDKHPNYEYTCYVHVKNAIPYINVWHATTMAEVYEHIKEIEKRHNRTCTPFYIDNDFYTNHYSLGSQSYYYRFMQRPVSDWEQLNFKNNIIDLHKKAG